MKSLRIIFAGTPEFGLPCLNALAETSHELVAIYTQPDRPAGRGRKLQASAVKEWAIARQIPVYQPINFKESGSIEEFQALKPDLMIVIAYGIILPEKILTTPTYGCINVHASLLPRWRGASPIQHAILYGDKESGVSIMQMDKGMDTGAVITDARCSIHIQDTSQTLHDRLATLAVEPLLWTLNHLGQLQSKPQDNTLATYAAKIKKEDALINWQQTALKIHQQIRAFNPWPGAYTQSATSVIKIFEAEIQLSSNQKPPGTILEINKNGILVGTQLGNLLLKRIQLPGGKIMAVHEWLNSKKDLLKVGDHLG